MIFTELIQLNKREHLSVRKSNLLHPFLYLVGLCPFWVCFFFLSFNTFWFSPAEQLMSPQVCF